VTTLPLYIFYSQNFEVGLHHQGRKVHFPWLYILHNVLIFCEISTINMLVYKFITVNFILLLLRNCQT